MYIAKLLFTNLFLYQQNVDGHYFVHFYEDGHKQFAIENLDYQSVRDIKKRNHESTNSPIHEFKCFKISLKGKTKAKNVF